MNQKKTTPPSSKRKPQPQYVQYLGDLGWGGSPMFQLKAQRNGAKATTKHTAKKPAAKPKATKKAALVDKYDNDGSDVEMSSDGGAGTSNSIPVVPEGSKKTASEKYTKVRPSILRSPHN